MDWFTPIFYGGQAPFGYFLGNFRFKGFTAYWWALTIEPALEKDFLPTKILIKSTYFSNFHYANSYILSS